jgi:hypothetical protein
LAPSSCLKNGVHAFGTCHVVVLKFGVLNLQIWGFKTWG